MNQQQIKQLLQNPDLPPAQRTALEAKLSDAAPLKLKIAYDPVTLDKAFEESEARYEASKLNYRFGGHNTVNQSRDDLFGCVSHCWHSAGQGEQRESSSDSHVERDQ